MTNPLFSFCRTTPQRNTTATTLVSMPGFKNQAHSPTFQIIFLVYANFLNIILYIIT